MKHALRKKDLIWLLGFPIYQIIGTIRHEGGHAISGLLEGVGIREFVFLPSFLNDRLRWGYVRYEGPVSWLTTIAPYFLDLIFFVIFYLICTRLKIKRHWIWINLVIIGMISPLVNSLYNYIRGMMNWNDIASLLENGPGEFYVHAYFVITGLIYILGLYLVFRKNPRGFFIYSG